MSTKAPKPRRILAWAHLDTHWGRQLIQGLSQGATRHHPWMLKVIRTVNELEKAVRDFRPDGMVLPHWRAEEYRLVRRHEIPTITVFTESATAEGTPVLALDNQAIGAMGARHLLETHIDHLAFIGWDDPNFSEQRREGFRRTVALACRTFEFVQCPTPEADRDPFAHDARNSAFAQSLEALPRPCAVMCSDDIIANTTALFCIRLGLRIPLEMAILGVNDDAVLCRSLVPNLSSIRLPFARIGMDAARLLEQWFDNGTPPQAAMRRYPPIEVAARESTSIQRIPDMVVTQALTYIEKHRHEEIKIADLLRLTGVSSGTLEKRFLRMLGHTPLVEIRRQRIQEAKRLLVETEDPIGAIARQTGFGSLIRFSIVFKELTGLTPTDYRQSQIK